MFAKNFCFDRLHTQVINNRHRVMEIINQRLEMTWWAPFIPLKFQLVNCDLTFFRRQFWLWQSTLADLTDYEMALLTHIEQRSTQFHFNLNSFVICFRREKKKKYSHFKHMLRPLIIHSPSAIFRILNWTETQSFFILWDLAQFPVAKSRQVKCLEY